MNLVAHKLLHCRLEKRICLLGPSECKIRIHAQRKTRLNVWLLQAAGGVFRFHVTLKNDSEKHLINLMTNFSKKDHERQPRLKLEMFAHIQHSYKVHHCSTVYIQKHTFRVFLT